MADSYEIIEDQVVPYSGGRMHTDTTSWRDASELELSQQKRIVDLENALSEIKIIAEYGAGDHMGAAGCCQEIAKIAYNL